ncbi:LptA/OstA family protein [Xanthobacter tagetidis]|uniref:Organic solvent tolerance protein OstA n=1 Tax=Xanthobacter tagetidis TaxID=60216 RepID=A0A3L7ARF1_9HYPH|nr:LptA/OstA family protein [Xanthobacter tagetidis]MBB6308326.1 lipopolysaccharide export system protein LptA [Xanthobacter tagetidis]RLP81998.1 organic solvent tolerance protein OstA [Xanthobacter tagetidis]
MSRAAGRARAVVLAALLSAGFATDYVAPAAAQQGNNVPNALQGFAKNRDQPVRINANTLEVRDKDKIAVFSGNVVVVQGDTTMNTKDLFVYYDGSVGAPQEGAPMKQGQIRKLEAKGGVVVKTKEQTATGDSGVFMMADNTVTLVGKPVVLTQGPNVIRGQKLVVDLVTGVSKFEGGRVESLIVPGSVKENAPPGGAKPGAAPAPQGGAQQGGAPQGGQAPRR